jgi:hypothetical protein
MDRTQHQRYLVYLGKYEYFGRGHARLGAAEFVALEAELATLDAAAPATRERRRTILATLLRD